MPMKLSSRVAASLGGVCLLVSSASSARPMPAPGQGPPAVCDVDVGTIARGDGQTDVTAAIQGALDRARPGSTLCVPPGRYMIDATRSLVLPGHVRLRLDPRAELRALPTSNGSYSVLTIKNVDDVVVEGGLIAGEREQHTGTAGQWGHGITIAGARKVTVRDVEVTDCWGDGIYVGRGGPGRIAPEDVEITGVRLRRNRRQGISIVAGRNVLVDGATVTDTSGTAPSAAIDIEPNHPDEPIDGVHIAGLRSERNKYGILVALTDATRDARSVTEIEVADHVDTGSQVGLALVAGSRTAGRLIVRGGNWSRSRTAGQLDYPCTFHVEVADSAPALRLKRCDAAAVPR